MSSSSSSVLEAMSMKYDVFISFRGEDTRNNFTSHHYEALLRKKIKVYIDDMLNRGEEISPAIKKAIDESKLSVIIFSENFASSGWCLDELVHILECKKTNGQFVIPVFHNIDPSHVRKQSGSYADAFAMLEKRFVDRTEKVLEWRAALTTAANLSGWNSIVIRGLKLLKEYFWMSKTKDINFSPAVFQKMYNLRILKIYNSPRGDRESNVWPNENFQSISDKLTYLQWE